MGGCCSCFDGISGGKFGGKCGGKSMEMSSRPGANGESSIPTGTGPVVSRAMSAPTIRIQGFKVSGSGMALASVPIEQDAAYWEWHVHFPGLPRPSPNEDDDGNENDDEFHDVQMSDGGTKGALNGSDEDPYAVKFGVATKKDRKFYKNLEKMEDDGGKKSSDDATSRDDGTVLMRSIPDLRHGDVVGVAIQQSDLPMIQFLLNGEPLPECAINRFRGANYPAIFIPPGAGNGDGDRIEDEGMAITAEFDEEGFKKMSPHARFGPLIAARAVI